MRRKMLETDEIESVIGLGPNLFYNSPMEAMILIGNTNKPVERKDKVLFINGKDDVVENKGQSYLTENHIKKLHKAFTEFSDVPHYCKVASLDEIMALNGNMNVNFYVESVRPERKISFSDNYIKWEQSSLSLEASMESLFRDLT